MGWRPLTLMALAAVGFVVAGRSLPRSRRPEPAELRAQAAITGEPIGMVVGDIDHFKRVNDEHGHAAGDAVLKDVALSLR